MSFGLSTAECDVIHMRPNVLHQASFEHTLKNNPWQWGSERTEPSRTQVELQTRHVTTSAHDVDVAQCTGSVSTRPFRILRGKRSMVLSDNRLLPSQRPPVCATWRESLGRSPAGLPSHAVRHHKHGLAQQSWKDGIVPRLPRLLLLPHGIYERYRLQV